MEKVRPWCGQPSDWGRLKNRTERVGLVKQMSSCVLVHDKKTSTGCVLVCACVVMLREGVVYRYTTPSLSTIAPNYYSHQSRHCSCVADDYVTTPHCSIDCWGYNVLFSLPPGIYLHLRMTLYCRSYSHRPLVLHPLGLHIGWQWHNIFIPICDSCFWRPCCRARKCKLLYVVLVWYRFRLNFI